ncbi:cytochrome P450 family protein [Streptomyces prasinus]|uniref:cytochrome P450 family protein n=1 Tax=Streptomyces prasinus TaxID=67345 RepID=UPI0033A04F15
MSETPAIDLLVLHPDFATDPYPAYAALRARGPVHLVRIGDDEAFWLVVGHEACRAAYTHPRLSRDWRRHGGLATGVPAPSLDRPGNAHMLLRDPPDHTRLRRLVVRAFTPRRIEALAPGIQKLTDRLLDSMLAAEDRRADLVPALAYPLRLGVICELLGVPGLDREAFRAWSDEVVAPTGPEAARSAHTQAVAHLTNLIAAKRGKPGQDLLSALIHTVDEGGDRLNEDELLSTAFLLLIAGHESTVNFICNGISALFAHPGQLALLRADPDGLIDGAVEEMLRHDSPVETSTPRIATGPVDIGGTVVPAGGVVLIVAADAGRDPARFPDPAAFDIRRADHGHLAFGHGAHYCLGAPLARVEGRIVFRTLLARCPSLAPDGRTDERVSSLLRQGIRRIPVRW